MNVYEFNDALFNRTIIFQVMKIFHTIERRKSIIICFIIWVAYNQKCMLSRTKMNCEYNQKCTLNDVVVQ